MSAALMGSIALSTSGVVLWWSVAGDRRLRSRAARNLRTGLGATTDLRAHLLELPASERVGLPLAERFVALVRAATPVGLVARLNAKILLAGRAGEWPVDRVLAAKVLGGGFGVAFGLLLVSSGNALATLYGLLLPVFGFQGPDLLLGAQGKRRQREIRLALPDTLDQVTVCVEAGLGFESALARAARSGQGPLSDEVLRTMQDIQLGVPRKDALRQLADRNGVDELRRFVLAVVQAEGYGVPIARVLRLQAAELREKRRQKAEEHAQKIGIKLLFPLVTCILPTVFIVILGPAILSLMDSLGGAT